MKFFSIVIGVLLIALARGLFFGLDVLAPLAWVWNTLAWFVKMLVYDLAPVWMGLLLLFAFSQRPLQQKKWRGM